MKNLVTQNQTFRYVKFDKHSILFLCLFIFTQALQAQTQPFFKWASNEKVNGIDTRGIIECYDVCVDASENVITTGTYFGTVDFDPKNGVYNLSSIGISEVFIRKLTAGGDLLWAKGLNSLNGSSFSFGKSITTDALGNVYATGVFRGTVDFNPGSGVFNLTGNNNLFVLKLDALGNFLWAKMLGQINTNINPYYEQVVSMELDQNQNIVLAGYYSGSADFDPNSGTFSMTSNGSYDVFVEKLDANGSFIWAKSFGGVDDDRCSSIAIDNSGNILTTGQFSGTVDFDPNSGVLNQTSAGGKDIFIHKLDANGNLQMALRFGGIYEDYGSGIAVDVFGSIYSTGRFTGTVDFDPSGTTANLVNSGGYTLKLGGNGSYLWAERAFYGPDYPKTISIDPDGDVFVGGYNIKQVGYSGFEYAKISRYNSNGGYIWDGALDATGGLMNEDRDHTNSVSVDGNGNFYTAGTFYGTQCDLNPTFGVTNGSGNDYGTFSQKLSKFNLGGLASNLNISIRNTMTINGGYSPILFYQNSSAIATVQPNGSTQLSGSVEARVWVDATQPANYVRRHYQITPATNASTATARVTLYFTQQEFNDYNAVNSTQPLPAYSNDAVGKANLKVHKFAGSSIDVSGSPTSYSGSPVIIDPADNDIIWNAALSRWEVSFNVAGFSGFFITTQAVTILPLTWLKVDGQLNADKQATINWQVQETDVAHYTIEKGSDGRVFTAMATISSKGNGTNSYQFTEVLKLENAGFYRIKQIDKSGKSSYSSVVRIVPGTQQLFTINPTLFSNGFNVNTSAAQSVILTNTAGQHVRTVKLSAGNNYIDAAGLSSGLYFLKTEKGGSYKLVKQ